MKLSYVFPVLTGFLFGTLSLADIPAPSVASPTPAVSAECPENCVPKKPTPKPKKKKKTPPAKPTVNKDTVDVKTTVIVKTEDKAPVPEKTVCKDVKHHTLDLLVGKSPSGLGLNLYKTQDRDGEYAFQSEYGWTAGLHYSYEFSTPVLFLNRVGTGFLSSNPATIFGSVGASW